MWYYAQNGLQNGPVELEQLRALISQGKVTATTLVWSPGMEQWLPAAETPVRDLLQATASPPPIQTASPPPAAESIQPIQLLKDAYASTGSYYLPMLVFFVPGLLVSIMTSFAVADGSPGSLVILWLLSSFCVFPFTTGAAIYYVQKNLTQQGVTIADSMQMAAQKFSQLVVATVLLWLVLIPATLMLILPGIYLSMRLLFVYYAVIIENRSAPDALARSMRLTRGYWWPIFRSVLVISVLIGLFSGAMAALFQGANVYISQIGGGVIGMLVGPVFSIYYVFLFMTLVNLSLNPSADGQPG